MTTETLSAQERHANGAVAGARVSAESEAGFVFQPFATTLGDEIERLRELGVRFTAYADQLAAREAQLAEDERRLHLQEEILQTREYELEQRRRELEALAARADAAQERLTEVESRMPVAEPEKLSGAGWAVKVGVGMLLLITLFSLVRRRGLFS